MTSRYPLARRFKDSFVPLIALVLTALARLLGIVVVVAPWLMLLSGGWRLFLRWYLLPYPFALVGFATIVALVSHRQVQVRVREGRAARGQRDWARPRTYELNAIHPGILRSTSPSTMAPNTRARARL